MLMSEAPAIVQNWNYTPAITLSLVLLCAVSRADTVGPESEKLDSLSAHIGNCKSAAGIRPVEETIGGVDDTCSDAVYLWSRAMPLSVSGVDEIREALRGSNIRLRLIEGETVERALSTADHAVRRLAENIAAAGGTAHYPALLLHKR